jgi:hypothetical protein
MFRRFVLAAVALALPAHAASYVYTFTYTDSDPGMDTSLIKSFTFQITLPKFYTTSADDGPLPVFTPFTVTDDNNNMFTLTQGRADFEFGFGNECFTFASATGTTFGNCGGGVGTGSILLASFLPPVSMTGGPFTPNIFQGNFGTNPSDYLNGSPGTGTMSLTVANAPVSVPEPSSIYLEGLGLLGLTGYFLARARARRSPRRG